MKEGGWSAPRLALRDWAPGSAPPPFRGTLTKRVCNEKSKSSLREKKQPLLDQVEVGTARRNAKHLAVSTDEKTSFSNAGLIAL